jgi:hypothetical protein
MPCRCKICRCHADAMQMPCSNQIDARYICRCQICRCQNDIHHFVWPKNDILAVLGGEKKENEKKKNKNKKKKKYFFDFSD